MNEHQVIITETTYGGRPELYDPDGIMDYGSLIYITLQRAKTAREAIQIIADLANEYGYASSGESFSIADKDEVWIMELIGKGSKLDKKGRNVRKGIVWVAARVPDGYICAMPTRPVSPTSTSMTLRTGSTLRTWWISPARWATSRVPTRSSASADAYAPLNFGALRGCEARVWSAFNILCDGVIGDRPADEYLDFAMGYNADNPSASLRESLPRRSA